LVRDRKPSTRSGDTSTSTDVGSGRFATGDGEHALDGRGIGRMVLFVRTAT
jgi:hypothetical protein